jgi:hypothetical protein
MQSFSARFAIAIPALMLAFFLGQADLAAEIAGFSYDLYGKLLKAHVDDRGMVDYQGLKVNSKVLDDFATSVSRLDGGMYHGWTDKERIAFWINAYNCLTLKAIVDNYPIQPSLLKSFVYPKNSIRQIPGVWDGLKFSVMGRDMTLDGIEHGILRAEFHDPRIHMALVCAAMGCPPLRNEPFTAAMLDAQLDDQAKRFLANPKKFRISRETDSIYLSPIFEWFGDDFIKKYGTDKEFQGFSEKERAVLNFVSHYLDSRDKGYIVKGGFSVKYLNYDWSLNEKQ